MSFVPVSRHQATDANRSLLVGFMHVATNREKHPSSVLSHCVEKG